MFSFNPPGWCLMSTRFLKCAYGWTFFSYVQDGLIFFIFSGWFGVMNACAGSKEREFQKFCRFSNFFWLIQTHHSTHTLRCQAWKVFFWWYIVEQPPVISHSKVLLLKTQMWPDRCLVTVEISVCILINNGLENLNWRSKCKTIISESNACRLGYWWLLYTFLWWQMPSKTCAEHVVEGSV